MNTEYIDGRITTELLKEAATIGQIVQERLNQSNVKSVRVFKVGRNEPCPCGSGKKFKYCCWNV